MVVNLLQVTLDLERRKQLVLYEERAKMRGFVRIAGVDEAGRGPLAGPVVAAACILPEGAWIEGVDDSKKLTPSRRFQLFEEIRALPGIDYGIGIIEPQIIDQINILQATFQAMIEAIAQLSNPPDYILYDGNRKPSCPVLGEAIVKGDSLSFSIAAASIIAKETRDQLMLEYDLQWPQYGFKVHKGYGTQMHLQAIREHGPCPIHRMSFAPIKSLITQEAE